MKIEHVALYVNDLEAAKDFFVRYLDAVPNEGYHNPRTDFRSYFLTFADGARLELMNKPGMSDEPKPAARTGYAHIAFSTGSREAVDALTARLLPMAEVLTPNIPEAEILSGMSIKNAADMEKAAQTISEKYGCAVLCKGGHQINDADDLLWRSGAGKWFRGRRIDNPNTHGTGCTLSSAIASNLAKGYDLDTSVERAKAYISGALAAMLDLGHGSGPMDHMFALKGEFTE